MLCVRAQFRDMGLAWLDQSVQCAPEVMRALHDALGFHNHVFARASLRADQCEKVISRQKQDGGLYSLLSPHHKYSTSTTQWTDTVSVQVSDMARSEQKRNTGADSGSLDLEFAQHPHLCPLPLLQSLENSWRRWRRCGSRGCSRES